MKSISKTFLYEKQDKAFGLKGKMLAYDPIMDNVKPEMIEEQIQVIHKRFQYPAKNIILNDLNDTIIPIFNKERITIPSYLPAYLMVNPKPNSAGTNKIIAIVNLTNNSKLNKTNDVLDIDARQLFGLLQTGEILLKCFYKWNSITMNQNVCKLGSLLYSRMFIKILDKMFAVNFDPIKADKIKFLASKFFLVNMLEKTSNNELINNICYANCTNGTTRNTINIFDEELNKNIYGNFANLIQQIALEIEGCSTLTVRTFLDTSLKLYGQNVLFAFEYFPLFLHTVFSVVIGSRFNQEYVLEGVFGKEADKLYTDFVSNFIR